MLSETDAEIVKRAKSNRVPVPGYNMYTEADDWFSRDVMKVPLRDIPESKKSFLPSHHERIKVSKNDYAPSYLTYSLRLVRWFMQSRWAG